MSKYKPYYLLVLVSLFFFYIFALNNIYNVLSRHILTDFNLTPSQVGFVSSLYFYGSILFLIPAGIMCDKFKIKNIIFFMMLLSASLTLLAGFVTNVIELAILRFLSGLCGAFGFIGCLKVATHLFEQKRLPKAVGMIATMGMLGGFFVQTPLSYLVQHTSWKMGFIAMGITGYIISITLFFTFKKDSFSTTQHREATYLANLDLKKIFFNSQNLLYAAYSSLMNFPIYMLGAMWGVPYLMTTGNFTEIQASFVSSMLFIGMMLGAPIIGGVANSYKKIQKIAFLGALFAILMILAILNHAMNYYIMCGLFFLLGFISSTQMLSYGLVVNNNPIHFSGTATSLVSIVSLLGGALIQPLFGSILSHFSVNNIITSHSYSVAICSLLVAFIVALIISAFFKEERR